MSTLAEKVTGLFSRAAEQAAAVEDAALRSDRFRLEREGDWKRLEAIVTRMEKGKLRKIPDEDVLALPALYRTVASSLSIARETSLDKATITYLEALTQRAWFLVYGPRQSLWGWLRGFLGGRWGAAVREIWLDILIALAVMVTGGVAGWLLVAHDSEWYYTLVGGMAQGREPGASREMLRGTLFGHSGESGLAVIAAFLFSNNAQVCILSFALGFAFAVPTLMLLVHNTANLGAMLWLFHGAGLLTDFIGWLFIHGTTELMAILLAGAAGVHIGRSMAFPGEASVLDAAAAAGRRAAQVMTGVIFMLIVAALLEGFGRQLVDETQGRFVVGSFMLVFWIGYLFVWRRGRFRGEAR